jgi:surfactin synthase thioesterase subunit
MKKEVRAKGNESVMLMISSCGQPVALVAAASIEEAQQRAVDLLRSDQGHDTALLTREAVVTVFSPAVVADGKTIAYVPTHVGSSHGIREGSARRVSTTPGTTH